MVSFAFLTSRSFESFFPSRPAMIMKEPDVVALPGQRFREQALDYFEMREAAGKSETIQKWHIFPDFLYF